MAIIDIDLVAAAEGKRRMTFRDRTDAGRRLAQALASHKDRNPAILALPRGGAPVAAEIAAALPRRSI